MIVAKKLSNKTAKLRFYLKKYFLLFFHLTVLFLSLIIICYFTSVIFGQFYGLPQESGIIFVFFATLIAELNDSK